MQTTFPLPIVRNVEDRSEMPKKNSVKQKKTTGSQWVPGQSGNPNGRPKKGETLTEILREHGQKKVQVNKSTKTLNTHLAETIYMAAVRGYRVIDGKRANLSPDTWVRLVEWLYDRVDGKPKEHIQVDEIGIALTSEDFESAAEQLEDWRNNR